MADLEIDLITRTAQNCGRQIILTNREFALLETLATRLATAGFKGQPGSSASGIKYFDPGSNVVNVYA